MVTFFLLFLDELRLEFDVIAGQQEDLREKCDVLSVLLIFLVLPSILSLCLNPPHSYK